MRGVAEQVSFQQHFGHRCGFVGFEPAALEQRAGEQLGALRLDNGWVMPVLSKRSSASPGGEGTDGP